VTNRPAATKGWLGQNAYIDAAPGPGQGRRTRSALANTGLGHFLSFDFKVNAAWLTAAIIGHPAGLAHAAGPRWRSGQSRAKTLRYRVLHAPPAWYAAAGSVA
jgi:hypothetical protein